MTKILAAAVLSVVGFSAQAHDLASASSGPVLTCSDARTMQRYATENEAVLGCGSINSPYVAIYTDYDAGFGAYVCRCQEQVFNVQGN